MICGSFCGHKLTYTNFTITFHILTFLMTCYVGFISAFLKGELNVLCSYGCSRCPVLLLEIYHSFYKQKRLDLRFMMKAAFGHGSSDTGSLPSLLAFRERVETSPDQWWAGASEWGIFPSLKGLCSPAVMGMVCWQGGWLGAVTFTQQAQGNEKTDTLYLRFRFGTLFAASLDLSGLGSLALWCSSSVSLGPPT